MAGTRKLTVEIAGVDKGLSSTLGTTEKKVGSLGSKFGAMSGKAKLAFAGATTAVFAFGKSSIHEFVEAEESQKKLADAFERFPNLAGTSQAALQKYNSELQKKTKYDDDSIASGQAVIAQFGITGKQLESITPLLLDYASRTGKDIPSAAQDVGKAMLGNAKALKNIGIKYKATGDKAKDFANISALLRKQVGGFAEKEGTTAAGKLAILQNQFGELQEKVGAKLVPALTKLADVALKVLNFFDKLSPGVKQALAVFAAAAAAIYVVVQATKAWTAVQAALNVVMTANPIGLVVIAIAAFVAGLVLAYNKVGWFHDFVDAAFKAVKTVIQSVFNWVKNNWPLLLAVLTGPIGLAVLAITKNWTTIKNAAVTVFNWVKSNWPLLLAILTGPFGLAVLAISRNWQTIKDGASAVKQWVVDKFNALVEFFKNLPGVLSGLASKAWNALKNGLKAAIDWIVAQIDRALGPLDELLGGLSRLGASNIKTPGDLPTRDPDRRALGGSVLAGHSYLVGERGPEMVTMGANGYVTPNSMLGGGGSQTLAPVVIELDGQVLGRAMIRFDANYRSTNGRSAFSG